MRPLLLLLERLWCFFLCLYALRWRIKWVYGMVLLWLLCLFFLDAHRELAKVTC
jgi:hypothetical protein